MRRVWRRSLTVEPIWRRSTASALRCLEAAVPNPSSASRSSPRAPLSPTLPFIASGSLPPSTIVAVREALFAAFDDPSLTETRDALGLKGARLTTPSRLRSHHRVRARRGRGGLCTACVAELGLSPPRKRGSRAASAGMTGQRFEHAPRLTSRRCRRDRPLALRFRGHAAARDSQPSASRGDATQCARIRTPPRRRRRKKAPPARPPPKRSV